jgi:hypothetical protein
MAMFNMDYHVEKFCDRPDDHGEIRSAGDGLQAIDFLRICADVSRFLSRGVIFDGILRWDRFMCIFRIPGRPVLYVNPGC